MVVAEATWEEARELLEGMDGVLPPPAPPTAKSHATALNALSRRARQLERILQACVVRQDRWIPVLACRQAIDAAPALDDVIGWRLQTVLSMRIQPPVDVLVT